MPRRARIIAPGTPLHVIQRGNNRQACFFTDEDYVSYLDWIGEYSQETGCQIHAYVLMTNHVHLLLTPQTPSSPGNLMKRLGQRYVQYVNRTYRRSGTLWEGRFRSCIIEQETYLLRCQRYIEMNPVRAGIVPHPAEYRWSSYGVNALGEPSKLISPHPLYTSMAGNAKQRQETYRAVFLLEADSDEIDAIRKATNGNFSLGSSRFQEEISGLLGRRVAPGKPGRPSKN